MAQCIRKRVATAPPSAAKLAGKIRHRQSRFEVDIVQICKEQEPKLNKVKYLKLDERIKRLADDCLNVDLSEYLNELDANVFVNT